MKPKTPTKKRELDSIEYILDRHTKRLKEIKYKGMFFRDSFKLIEYIENRTKQKTLKDVLKIIDEMKLHNTSDENRIYNSALKELKQKLKEGRG